MNTLLTNTIEPEILANTAAISAINSTLTNTVEPDILSLQGEVAGNTSAITLLQEEGPANGCALLNAENTFTAYNTFTSTSIFGGGTSFTNAVGFQNTVTMYDSTYFEGPAVFTEPINAANGVVFPTLTSDFSFSTISTSYFGTYSATYLCPFLGMQTSVFNFWGFLINQTSLTYSGSAGSNIVGVSDQGGGGTTTPPPLGLYSITITNVTIADNGGSGSTTAYFNGLQSISLDFVVYNNARYSLPLMTVAAATSGTQVLLGTDASGEFIGYPYVALLYLSSPLDYINFYMELAADRVSNGTDYHNITVSFSYTVSRIS